MKIRGHHLTALFVDSDTIKQYFGIELHVPKSDRFQMFLELGYVSGYDGSEQETILADFLRVSDLATSQLMADPNNLVEIVVGTKDYVCNVCPLNDYRRDVTKRCPDNPDNAADRGRRVDFRDNLLGLEEGSIYTVQQIADAFEEHKLSKMVSFLRENYA